jgi:hypothetical protein
MYSRLFWASQRPALEVPTQWCIMQEEGAGTLGRAEEDRLDGLLSPKYVVLVLVEMPSCHEPRDRFD